MTRATLMACAALTPFMLFAVPALAASDADVQEIKAEIREMKRIYEDRIAELEAKLARLEKAQGKTRDKARKKAARLASATPATGRRDVFGSSFNPAISVVFNGRYQDFSSEEGEIAGFSVGEEGQRGDEGFSVDHTELNFSANVDDKFFGNVNAALVEHGGETEVELEEAYVQTLPDAGLPDGLSIKAGRAFWTLGYLNEHHAHVDDFADRPLPYRVFLDEAFNDDGVEASYVLPTELYAEVGVGAFRGDDFPFAEGDGEGVGTWSAFARIGGDIGDNQSWRIGGYVLSGEAEGDGEGEDENDEDGHGHGDENNEDSHGHGDEVPFVGDVNLYFADLRYTWMPTGNAREQEVILQAEYFRRDQDGDYMFDEGSHEFDDDSGGWYVQGVYRFHPQWRIGARYSRLEAPGDLGGTDLDPDGHDPEAYAVMMDWTNSEFSRVRVQYNREELARGQDDDQIILQYIMAIGAHAAHKY